MMTNTMPPVSIASTDLRRLKQVAARALQDRHPVGRFLFSELERASACAPDASDRCVRLDEWVTFRADEDGPLESRMLVLPDNFRSSTVHLSVLSPLGAALLGLQAGARMPLSASTACRISPWWRALIRRMAWSRSANGAP